MVEDKKWERICVRVKDKFPPYLNLNSILTSFSCSAFSSTSQQPPRHFNRLMMPETQEITHYEDNKSD